MTIQKLILRFVMVKNKIRIDGRAPLYCRLTYKERRKQFSTGLFVIPKEWNSKKQVISPVNSQNQFSNTQIDLIKADLNQSFLLLQVKKGNFDVDDIYLQYKGESTKEDKTLLEVFQMHNSKMESLIDRDYSRSTYRKFIEANNHIKNFITYQYKKQDYLLSDLSLKFIQDLDYYLKYVKNQKQITINKCIQRLRKIVKLAIGSGYLVTDPFLLYRPKKVVSQVVFLNEDELIRLEKYEFTLSRLNNVRDLFIFCCYTGLAYAEMKALKSEHIKTGFDRGNGLVCIDRKQEGVLMFPYFQRLK